MRYTLGIIERIHEIKDATGNPDTTTRVGDKRAVPGAGRLFQQRWTVCVL